MGSFEMTRSGFFDEGVDWWRRFLSGAFTWAADQLGHSPDFSWRAALQFVNDYLLLPIVVLLVLVLLVKRTLSH